jgi:hypothetical protein
LPLLEHVSFATGKNGLYQQLLLGLETRAVS